MRGLNWKFRVTKNRTYIHIAIGSGTNACVRREGSEMDVIIGQQLRPAVFPLVEPVEWSRAVVLFRRAPGHERP